ncbi:MAG: hypothetical protein HS115_10740 [Spirochaetales bacterium]|nr:hypothetical protein [Spirochaetales bacterium]
MLDPARRLLEEGRYEEAFRMVSDLRGQKEVDPEVFYLGSLSLFGLGHVYQAEEWVRSFGKATGSGPDYHYLEAYIQLHHRRFDQALICWTEILQMDPSQTLADQLIERVKQGEEAVLEDIRIPANFREYIPVQRRPFRRTFLNRSVLRWGLAFLLGTLLLFLAFYFYRTWGTDGRPELLPPAHITLIPPASYGKDDRPETLYASVDEIKADFAEIQRFQEEGKPNAVLRLLGKLELSNAGFEVKERATTLRQSVFFAPDFDDPISVSEVQKAPFALRGVRVRWKGQILFAGERDFLFQADGVQVRVFFSRNPEFKPGQKVEVRGVFQKILREGTIILEGHGAAALES